MKRILIKINGAVIDQTEGKESELNEWLLGNLHKYPEGFSFSYEDLTSEVSLRVAKEEKRQKYKDEMDAEISKIKTIAEAKTVLMKIWEVLK